MEKNIPQEDFLFAYDQRRYIVSLIKKVFSVHQFLTNEEPEDLANEVVIKIAENLRNVEDRSTVQTWIGTITINTARDHLRRPRNNPRMFDPIDNAVRKFADGYSQTPEQIYLLKERMEEMFYKVNELTENQQTILRLLANDEELSYRDISQKTGISLSGVKSLIFRAREKMKTHKETA